MGEYFVLGRRQTVQRDSKCEREKKNEKSSLFYTPNISVKNRERKEGKKITGQRRRQDIKCGVLLRLPNCLARQRTHAQCETQLAFFFFFCFRRHRRQRQLKLVTCVDKREKEKKSIYFFVVFPSSFVLMKKKKKKRKEKKHDRCYHKQIPFLENKCMPIFLMVIIDVH